MTKNKTSFENVKLGTRGVYERNASHWDKDRPRTLYEKQWLDLFKNKIPVAGHILDLGCGTGDPIAKYFLDEGYYITGLDYCPSMIEIAEARYPQANWAIQDMQSLKVETLFDGIISWDAFFHLSQQEQRVAIPRISDYVKLGGAILLTVGPDAGVVTGTVAGEAVYHASLSIQEYKRLFIECGFQNIDFYPNEPQALGRSILIVSDKS